MLDGIAVHEGAGDECAPISDRAALVALYEATDGPNWTNQDNWLTHAPLKDWYGVEVNAEGRVISLDLYRNGLVGELPSGIGQPRRARKPGAWPQPPDGFDSAGTRQPRRARTPGAGTQPPDGPIPPELGNLSELAACILTATN